MFLNQWMKPCAAASLLLSVATSASLGAPTLVIMPGNGTSTLTDLSGDGTIAVGHAVLQATVYAFHWTPPNGVVSLNTLFGPPFGAPLGVPSHVSAVSHNGSFFAGGLIGAFDRNAYRLSSGGQLDNILGPTPPWPYSVATSISADGAVVAGNMGTSIASTRPFRWTSTDGLSELSMQAGWNYCRVNAISGDGQVIVGTGGVFTSSSNTSAAVRWTNGVRQSLGFLPGGGSSSFAVACNSDGSVIVGKAGDPANSGQERATRWTAETGMVKIDRFGIGTSSEARDVSDDGNVVVGSYLVGTTVARSFYWSSEAGIIDLQDFLTTQGLDVSAWTLFQAQRVSADGTTIMGSGKLAGLPYNFLITNVVRPTRCAADIDDDGSFPAATPDGWVDIGDLLFFLAAFEAGSTNADLCDSQGLQPGDGGIDINDLLFFLTHFEAGC